MKCSRYLTVFLIALLALACRNDARAYTPQPVATEEQGQGSAVAAPTVATMESGEKFSGVRIESLDQFERMAILHDGRKMPLHTYARLVLLQLSGRTSVAGMSAEAWMARMLFEPVTTLEDPIFLINHPGVAQAIGVEVQDNRRYTFTALHSRMGRLRELAQRASELEREDRSQVENEVIRVYRNVHVYLDLFHSLGFARPHPDFMVTQEALRERMELPEGRAMYSFADIFFRASLVQGVIEPLTEKPQSEWTDVESEAFRLSNNIYQMSQQYQGIPFAIIPMLSHGEEVWFAPWDTIALGFREASAMEAVRLLAEMNEAYLEGQQIDFDIAARRFNRIVDDTLAGDREMAYLTWEVWFNNANLFGWSKLFYGLAFLCAFASLIARPRWIYWASLAFMVAALITHTAGMGMRMMIMGRPPMTNLYSTFIFVSWIGVILALATERFQKNSIGLLTGSVTGFLLLAFSLRFYVQGDSMGQVVAVLDSNFWLSTHVTTITAGYAGCLLAGVIGHIYLLQAVIAPQQTERLRSVYFAMLGMLGFGLTFSFLGTMLGGVWADQSWGRFWGWDPKENGALLIVLWCSILFHAKIAKMINDLVMAAGCIFGAIIVMMAWLGVNLLGVGLHSYGFTSGLATNLFIYTGIELAFIAIFTPWAWIRTRKHAHEVPDTPPVK